MCFVIYMELDPTGETCLFEMIPDECADIARSQGWHVLARDSDMWPAIEPAQSNPHRRAD